MWGLRLIKKDGSFIDSPAIVPDSPWHDYFNPRILMKIARIGKEIVELDEDIVNFKVLDKEK